MSSATKPCKLYPLFTPLFNRTDEQKSERFKTCLQGCLDYLPGKLCLFFWHIDIFLYVL